MSWDNSTVQQKRPLYMKIYSDLLEQIQKKVFPIGSKLPSEKEIAAQYNVSRITSKKAMDTLTAGGFIIRTPGRGTFVIKNGFDHKELIAYEPPSIVAGRTRLIGVVIEKFSSSFGGDLVLGIEQECTCHGYTLALRCTYHDKNAEDEAITQLLGLGVSGLIIMCVYDEIYNPLILKLSLEKFPVVLVDRKLSGIPLPCVATNNKLAAQKLTDALFSRGHKHLAFVLAEGSFKTSTVVERSQGFTKSCLDHGDRVDLTDWVTGLKSTDIISTPDKNAMLEQEDVDLLKRYMLEHSEITGYVAASYDVALLVRKADRECYAKTGMRHGVACFDAPESLFEHEQLLHIRQNQKEIGKVAVRQLLSLIQNEQIDPIYYVDFELIE